MDILEDMLHPEDLVIEAELAGAPEGQVPHQSSHAHMMLCKLLQEHHTQHVLSKAKWLKPPQLSCLCKNCQHVRAAFEEEKVSIRKKMASSMSTVLGSKESAADRVGSTQLSDDEQPQVVPQPFEGLACRACRAYA